MKEYRVIDGNETAYRVVPNTNHAGAKRYFTGSFADCWAWIQYQEYLRND